jgi:D-proline reductase (dithiol) PrdB
MRSYIAKAKLPAFDTQPCTSGPPLNRRRVALVSTAGLHRRDDRPFTLDPWDCYRIIPGDTTANDLIMSHISPNFDRSGFQQDWNVVFPLDRLRELSNEAAIGSVAGFHYSFMGANDPQSMEHSARKLAVRLHEDQVNALLLVPV